MKKKFSALLIVLCLLLSITLVACNLIKKDDEDKKLDSNGIAVEISKEGNVDTNVTAYAADVVDTAIYNAIVAYQTSKATSIGEEYIAPAITDENMVAKISKYKTYALDAKLSQTSVVNLATYVKNNVAVIFEAVTYNITTEETTVNATAEYVAKIKNMFKDVVGLTGSTAVGHLLIGSIEDAYEDNIEQAQIKINDTQDEVDEEYAYLLESYTEDAISDYLSDYNARQAEYETLENQYPNCSYEYYAIYDEIYDEKEAYYAGETEYTSEDEFNAYLRQKYKAYDNYCLYNEKRDAITAKYSYGINIVSSYANVLKNLNQAKAFKAKLEKEYSDFKTEDKNAIIGASGVLVTAAYNFIDSMDAAKVANIINILFIDDDDVKDNFTPAITKSLIEVISSGIKSFNIKDENWNKVLVLGQKYLATTTGGFIDLSGLSQYLECLKGSVNSILALVTSVADKITVEQLTYIAVNTSSDSSYEDGEYVYTYYVNGKVVSEEEYYLAETRQQLAIFKIMDSLTANEKKQFNNLLVSLFGKFNQTAKADLSADEIAQIDASVANMDKGTIEAFWTAVDNVAATDYNSVTVEGFEAASKSVETAFERYLATVAPYFINGLSL